MNQRSQTLHWFLLVLLGAASRSTQAQRMVEAEQQPRLFGIQLTDKYLQTDMEYEQEFQRLGTADSAVTRQRFLFQPVVGLGIVGSVYHPNLLEYHLNTELGADFQSSSVDPCTAGSNTKFLQRYNASMDFLQQKPYATTLFAEKDETYRDYDFFTRVRVNSDRYGGRTGYSAGPVPISVSAQHYEEYIEDPTRPTRLIENTLNFNAQSLRRSDQARTHLNYSLDQFSRADDGYGTQRGLNQNLNLFDNETFGAQGWVNINSLLNFNIITETQLPTDRLLLQENLRLQHTPKLRSFYEYAFDTASLGDSDSNTHQGRVGLAYQPIESLASTLDLHGIATTSTSPGAYAETRRYGFTLDEQFNKPLGTWGSLMLGYNGRLDREERNTSGQTVNVIGETHTLSDSTTTFLNQPLADVVTIRVTDQNRTTTYVEGLDYRLIPQGALVEIERITNGRIPNPGTVVIDYSAVLQPSAGYYSLDNTFVFRVDLWHSLLGIYGRWSILDYSGAGQLLLRWLNVKTIGVDSTWRWLRTGAEYEVAESNMAPYDRVRLFQSVQFQASETTTFGADLDQNWTHFRDTGLGQNTYGLIVRYQQRLNDNLSWNAEGGMRIDRGFSFDRNVAVARLGLEWTFGKLTARLGYEYGNESQPSSEASRQFAHLRVRRTF